MISTQVDILCIAAIALYGGYNIHALYFACKILNRFRENFLLILCVSSINSFLLFYSYALHFPYYVTYIIGLIVLCLECYFCSKTKFTAAYFCAAIILNHIIWAQMAVIGMMSIVLRRPPVDMLIIPQLFYINIISTFLIANFILVLLKKWVGIENLIAISRDKQQSIMVSLVGTFIILYSCFDSIAFTYPKTFSNLPTIILSTAVLSAVSFTLLLTHAIKISKGRHLISKAHQLECTLREDLKVEEKLKVMAFRDNLTGAYFRSYALKHLDELLFSKKSGFSVVYMDLDRLKYINDTFGHAEGDCYIKNVSRCITGSMRENDVFARMGGDEFILILENCNDLEAEYVLNRADIALKEIEKDMNKYPMNLSYGIVYVDEKLAGKSRYEIMELADQKMYQSKGKGSKDLEEVPYASD